MDIKRLGMVSNRYMSTTEKRQATSCSFPAEVALAVWRWVVPLVFTTRSLSVMSVKNTLELAFLRASGSLYLTAMPSPEHNGNFSLASHIFSHSFNKANVTPKRDVCEYRYSIS